MKKQIHDALSALLTSRLSKYSGQRFDSTTCKLIYQDMFECIVDVFQESGASLSNESVNLVAQMYYDSVTVKDNCGAPQVLDPNIFDKLAKTENIETRELAMLATMFNGTPFAPIFIHAVKRRS